MPATGVTGGSPGSLYNLAKSRINFLKSNPSTTVLYWSKSYESSNISSNWFKREIAWVFNSLSCVVRINNTNDGRCKTGAASRIIMGPFISKSCAISNNSAIQSINTFLVSPAIEPGPVITSNWADNDCIKLTSTLFLPSLTDSAGGVSLEIHTPVPWSFILSQVKPSAHFSPFPGLHASPSCFKAATMSLVVELASKVGWTGSAPLLSSSPTSSSAVFSALLLTAFANDSPVVILIPICFAKLLAAWEKSFDGDKPKNPSPCNCFSKRLLLRSIRFLADLSLSYVTGWFKCVTTTAENAVGEILAIASLSLFPLATTLIASTISLIIRLDFQVSSVSPSSKWTDPVILQAAFIKAFAIVFVWNSAELLPVFDGLKETNTNWLLSFGKTKLNTCLFTPPL